MDYFEENLGDPSTSFGKNPKFPEIGQEAICTTFRETRLHILMQDTRHDRQDTIVRTRAEVTWILSVATVSSFARALTARLLARILEFDVGIIQLVLSCRSDIRRYRWPMKHVVDIVVNRFE